MWIVFLEVMSAFDIKSSLPFSKFSITHNLSQCFKTFISK